MRLHLPVILFTLFASLLLFTAGAQPPDRLQTSWFLIKARSVNGDTPVTNPFYAMRFDAGNIFVRFANYDKEMHTQPYHVTEKELQIIPNVVYHIDSLSDSLLILTTPTVKYYFTTDEKLLCNAALFTKVGELEGSPVYSAAPVLEPMLPGESTAKIIAQTYHDKSLWTHNEILVSFIVDEKGVIHDKRIIEGSSPKIDAIFLKKLEKTSGKWQPSTRCGDPVAVLVTKQFRFK